LLQTDQKIEADEPEKTSFKRITKARKPVGVPYAVAIAIDP